MEGEQIEVTKSATMASKQYLNCLIVKLHLKSGIPNDMFFICEYKYVEWLDSYLNTNVIRNRCRALVCVGVTQCTILYNLTSSINFPKSLSREVWFKTVNPEHFYHSIHCSEFVIGYAAYENVFYVRMYIWITKYLVRYRALSEPEVKGFR